MQIIFKSPKGSAWDEKKTFVVFVPNAEAVGYMKRLALMKSHSQKSDHFPITLWPK
jgi:hypothetical protein